MVLDTERSVGTRNFTTSSTSIEDESDPPVQGRTPVTSIPRNPIYLPSNNNNQSTLNPISSIFNSSSMLKTGAYPVTDPAARTTTSSHIRSTRRDPTDGGNPLTTSSAAAAHRRRMSSSDSDSFKLFLRILLVTCVISIPIVVLVYVIYYEPINQLMVSSSDHHSQSRSLLYADDNLYKVDSLTSVFVKTNSGTIQGERLNILNKEVDIFLGVPYAEPPIGDLRFRKTKEVKPWNGIYRAIRHSRPCLQARLDHRIGGIPWVSPVTSSEDCLYLNIWSTFNKKANNKNLHLKPVLIWIPSGQFISGSSDMDAFDGGVFSAYGDVVVVNFNYRLGPLGFMNANDELSPGNMGLYDQVTAIKWVKQNIEFFGGNPEEITLGGQGAGAISVGYHLVSPLTRNLFKRGILHSGSPLNPQILEDQRTSMDRTQQLAIKVSCANDRINVYTNPGDVVNCLRKLDGNFLVKTAEELSTGIHTLFAPMVGNDFLPVNPYAGLKTKSELGPRKDLLIGTVKDEGSYLLHWAYPKIFTNYSPRKLTREQVSPLAEEIFKFIPSPGPKAIAHIILNDMGQSVGESHQVREKFTQSLGDFVTTCPSVFFSEQMQQHNFSVYHFQFKHRPHHSKWGHWMGTVQFDEIPFIFGLPFTKSTEFTDTERELSAQMMEFWVHFLRSGKPSPNNENNWPAFTPIDRRYRILDIRSSEVGYGPREHQCNMWRFMFQANPVVG